MSKHIQVDYKKWGCGSVAKMLAISANDEIVKTALIAIEKIFSVGQFHFESALGVNYFQGKNAPDLELLLLRFNTSDTKKNNVGQSHVSVLINPIDNKIFGYMDLRDSPSTIECTTHQAALQAAVLFLQKSAPDFIPQQIQLPSFPESKVQSEAKLTFDNHPKLGVLELHWIGVHKEFVESKNGLIEIRGMKVKLFHRERNLWSWVIINKNNEVICYERDVFWNFAESRRESQMWLHDNWRIIHKLI